MKKLIITADIHGNLTSWLTFKSLLNRGDGLVVAGDLFDTRYGSYADPEFQPDEIRKDMKTIDFPLHYVYGNCDTSGFLPGYHDHQTFTAFDKKIYLHHGHRPIRHSGAIDIVIQGHTHLCSIEEKEGIIYLNPGSITSPRNALYTYGIIDRKGISLVKMETGKPLVKFTF